MSGFLYFTAMMLLAFTIMCHPDRAKKLRKVHETCVKDMAVTGLVWHPDYTAFLATALFMFAGLWLPFTILSLFRRETK